MSGSQNRKAGDGVPTRERKIERDRPQRDRRRERSGRWKIEGERCNGAYTVEQRAQWVGMGVKWGVGENADRDSERACGTAVLGRGSFHRLDKDQTLDQPLNQHRAALKSVP
jgi:hypothetical protein